MRFEEILNIQKVPFKCEHLDASIIPCKFYIKGGYCKGEFYRCKEFLIRKMKLHQSQIKEFERCPLRFYISEILGFTPKPEYLPLSIRRGQYLHSLISKTPMEIPFWPDEEAQKTAVEEIYSAILELELIPNDVSFEIIFEKDSAEGILDIVGSNFFGEIKFTERPDFYLNNRVAYFQLAYYFYLSNFAFAFILPIRVPSLRKNIDESLENYRERLKLDIRRRINFYFPEYDKEKTPFKWGRKFYISEFDLDEIKARIDYLKFLIKLSIVTDYFPRKVTGCMFPSNCEFQSICETNYINPEIFMRKELPKNSE